VPGVASPPGRACCDKKWSVKEVETLGTLARKKLKNIEKAGMRIWKA